MSEKQFHEMEQVAQQYAKAKADRVYLEQYRKSKKALLMKEAELQGHKTSAQQEREAYAHAEYVQLLEGLRAATEAEESLRWKLTLFQTRFDTWRTQQANQRAEMNLR